MSSPRIEWTHENCAYAAAQWASGIQQKAIARHFGVRTAASICQAIERFVDLWGDDDEVQRRDDRPDPLGNGSRVVAYGEGRRALVKGALRHFVAHRAWLASKGAL